MQKIVFFCITALLSVLFQPCAQRAGAAAAISESFTVGVILPFSSAFTSIADEQKNAIELAAADAAGSTLQLLFKDGRDNKEGAIQAFNELMALDHPPQAVITCASWAAEAINPLAAEHNIFHIAIGSAALHRAAPGHTVRFTLDASKEEAQLALYLSRFHRIAVLHMDNSYGNSWARVIQEKFGSKVVAVAAYEPTSDDFSKPLTTIKAAEPEVLVLLSAGKAGLIARQARALGITAQLAGTRPIERPELLEAYEAVKGLVYTYPSYNARHPFISQFANVHAMTPTIFACEAYQAANSLSQAVSQGSTSADQLFAWYAGQTHTGVLGEVRFDQAGDASYPYLFKEVADHAFRVADFQFPLILENTRQEVNHALHEMHEHIEIAEEQLSESGLQSERAQEILQTLYDNTLYAFDCSLINDKGIIVKVAPHEQITIVGKDISHQEQMVRLYQTKQPVVSLAIDTVEGFASFDLEHPLFDPKGTFIGSVSILTKPDIFDSVISRKVANFPVEMWMMQTDGRILYDPNPEEIGRNLFTDPLYADYPSLIKVGRQMAMEPQGQGEYTFMNKMMQQPVTKTLLWTTIALHDTEFRLALSYVKQDFESGQAASPLLSMGTANVTGVVFPVGGAVAKIVNDRSAENGFRLAVVPSRGSVFNINAVLHRELDLAVAQADMVFEAASGQGKWQEAGPRKDLRAICSLYTEMVALVAAEKSGITRVNDIRAKKVSLGEPGSGTLQNARKILAAYGLAAADLDASYLPATEEPGKLQSGQLDAFFLTMGQSNPVISQAAILDTIRLIDINNPAIDHLVAQAPYYVKCAIPRTLYPNIANSKDCQTFGIPATLIIHASMDDAVAYGIAKSIFEQFEAFTNQHPALAGLQKEAILEGLTAPIHPGALKYFKEVGLR